MTLTVALLLSSLALSQAAVLERYNSSVVNKVDAKPGEIPYQVSLQDARYNIHFCGGSIINEYFVITAAYCVTYKAPRSFKVIAGAIHLDDPQSVHEVENIIVHENYDLMNSFLNDIALIKVKTPFKKSQLVSFVPLPDVNDVFNTDDAATVSGWEKISLEGVRPNTLQVAKIYIADQEHCRRTYEPLKTVFDSQICAYGGEGACTEDDGGPLTIKGKLVGIGSWASWCILPNHPTVFTRVTSYLDWIEAHTK